MTINKTELRTIANRIEAHLNDIEGRSSKKDKNQFALRSGQIALEREAIAFWREPKGTDGINDRGYFLRPTGTGKTVSLINMIIGANTLPSGVSVLGDKARGKRAIIMVPQNFLLDQWENELLGEITENGDRSPSKWGDIITPKDVGIYRATATQASKRAALEKPILVVTYDSARNLCDKTRGDDDLKINPEDFSLTILDEVHDKPRGEVTGQFIRENFFDKSLVIGATATHLYKSGKTIGDYLFDGQAPFHETTFREAVNRGEICPMRNVIAEVQLDEQQRGQLKEITDAAVARAKKNSGNDEIDYTEKELERIVEITQRDEAAVRMLQRGSDPDTGKKYRDMKQVWYCASIKHAQSLAAKLNKEMGSEDYAVAVHGQMNGSEQSAILLNYHQGNHRALANCQLLTMGFDDREAELCMQIAPTRSPIRSLQQGGRVMRIDPNNPNKIANIVTFLYPGIEQVIFGELAQGMVMLPKDFEFTPSTSGGTGVETRPWPEIEGLKVYYTTEQLTLFAEDREKQRLINGLPVKTDSMLTASEMASELFPNASSAQLEMETQRLQRRIFDPLKAAYDIREAREKFVGLDDVDTASKTKFLAVSGQRFPVWQIGYYSEGKKQQFCISKDAAILCRYGMYGKITKRTPDLLSEAQTRTLLGIKNDAEWQSIIDPLKDAYLDRAAYERNIKMGNISLPIDQLGIFLDRGSPAFCIQPDSLIPLYQHAKGVTEEVAKQWWKTHSVLPKLKTSDWMNLVDTKEALGIGALSEAKTPFEDLWKSIMRKSLPPLGQETKTSVNIGSGKKDDVRIAKKQTLGDNTIHNCVHRQALNLLAHCLGLESDYDGPDGPARKASR